MSGTILRVLPRTRYDFANVSESNSVTVWLQQNIDVSRWEEATLLRRAHDSERCEHVSRQSDAGPTDA